jgi:hypothetical protein
VLPYAFYPSADNFKCLVQVLSSQKSTFDLDNVSRVDDEYTDILQILEHSVAKDCVVHGIDEDFSGVWYHAHDCVCFRLTFLSGTEQNCVFHLSELRFVVDCQICTDNKRNETEQDLTTRPHRACCEEILGRVRKKLLPTTFPKLLDFEMLKSILNNVTLVSIKLTNLQVFHARKKGKGEMWEKKCKY